MASTAGSIVLGIFADVAQLKTDLQRANHNIEDFSSKATRSLASLTKMAGGFASAFTGIGLALSGTALAAVAKQAIEVADNIGDMAERLGVGTDALQALQYAARDVGADAEGMATGIAKLNKLLGEAGAGNKEAIKSFADLGVAFGEAGKLRSTEDVLRSVADRIAGAGSVAEKTRLAVEVFGKSGAALVPIFAKGAAGIDELVAKLREMGVIVDGAALKQADALQKQFDQLAATLQTTLIKAVLAFGPALASLATETQKSVEWFARLVDRVADLATPPCSGPQRRVASAARGTGESPEDRDARRRAGARKSRREVTALERERDAASERKREAAAGRAAGGPAGPRSWPRSIPARRRRRPTRRRRPARPSKTLTPRPSWTASRLRSGCGRKARRPSGFWRSSARTPRPRAPTRRWRKPTGSRTGWRWRRSSGPTSPPTSSASTPRPPRFGRRTARRISPG